jgi:predicted amidohydrolase YtcJ
MLCSRSCLEEVFLMSQASASRSILPVVPLAFLLAGIACSPSVEPAHLVLRNGRIVTVDDARPEAQAMATTGETIVAVGTNEEIARYVGEKTEVIDLQGRLAIPGFIEGHGHFLGVGNARLQLRLMDTKSWDEIVSMVAEASRTAPPGEWIRGRGWHQEKWGGVPTPNVEGFPTHESLSKVSPENPVILTHASGHASFVNAKALEVSGITRATPNPPGGEILKDARGNPTGLLRETASRLAKVPPADDPDLLRKQAALAADEAISKGITSFQDAGTSFAGIDVLKALASEGRLPLRLWVMVRDSVDNLRANLAKYRTIGEADRHLTIRAIKLTIDGALGSRGAWLLEPYTDLPTSSGLNTASLELANETADLAAQHDYQFCVHAIGDRANREALDIFERVYKANPGKALRWRIEHAQHLHPDDIPRFGQLGVIASMQGVHCTSDAVFVPARLGAERSEQGAYVWQKLMKSGAVVTNGTDAPVEDVDPIASFYASVSRKLKDGTVFYPDQRMSRQEALKSYTWNTAYAAFEEDIKGSLASGKLADVVVLSKDIMSIPEDEIPTARVVLTIVGGRVVYRAGAAQTAR